MSKPPLPARVTSLVRAITADTWNQLLACVEYAMQNPRGDGKTIRNHGEILQAVVPGRQGVSSVPKKEDLSDSGNPNFKISYVDGVLSCSGGFFSRNGICEYITPQPLAVDRLTDGCVFLYTRIVDGHWTRPELEIGSFFTFYTGLFPIGEVYNGKIVQYDVKLATFLIATECPVNVRM